MSGAAAALAARRNRRLWRIIDAFRLQGAVSPTAAKSLETLGVSDASWVRTLAGKGVLVRGPQDLWHLDEPALAAWQAVRRRRAIAILCGVALLVLAVIALSAR